MMINKLVRLAVLGLVFGLASVSAHAGCGSCGGCKDSCGDSDSAAKKKTNNVTPADKK
jgi:hypothetical protein